MRLFRMMCWMGVFLGLLHFSFPAQSQTSETNKPAADSTPTPAPASPALKPAELDALVAPVALYPDPLLANVLMAATYPLEVVRAARWMDGNKNLKGDALKEAAEKQDWDQSVKSLVAAPSVLQMMNDHLDWTQKLGEAFLAQQQDVMDAVQRLRTKAYERNKLVTTKEQTVSVREEQSRKVVYIEPASSDTVYVPYYEPQTVYGDWPYADYPAYPYYWGYPGYIAAGVIATGIAFGAGYALGRWVSGRYWGGGGYWGASRVNWGGGAINVNRGARVEHWQHNPAHRQGARYNNANLQQKFGNTNRPNAGDRGQRAGADRGQAGRQTGAGKAAGNRQAGAGNRQAGNRQAGNRQAGNKQAGNRQGSRSRQAAARPSNRGASRAGQFRPAAGARPGGGARFAGGGARAGGGGGFRGGGGGGFRGGGGRGGGGRRSDVRLKHDVAWLGRLDNGLGYYRFAYNGSDKLYVGVIAQEVQTLRPDAVVRGSDGYLRVYYQRLGLPFQSYDAWVAAGARLPAGECVGMTRADCRVSPSSAASDRSF